MRAIVAFVLGLSWCAAVAAQPATVGLEVSGFNGPFGAPTVSFSAELHYDNGKSTVEGRVVAIPKRERWEFRTGGVTVISILYADLGRGYTVLPAQRMYLEVDQAATYVNDTKWTVQREGEDTIDGLLCGRYAVEGVRGNGDRYQATMWLAEAYNLVIRAQGNSVIGGTARPVHLQLSNIQTGPQDPALFEPPPDYRRFGTGLDAPPPPPARIQP